MSRFRKFALAAGLLLAFLSIASAVTPAFAARNLAIKHASPSQMPTVTVSPVPNNSLNKHGAASGLTGLPDDNSGSHDDPRANEPGSINVSF